MNGTQGDLRLLRVFVAVAEAASFSKAAKVLGTTKATVSRSIARLERDLGAELLHRTTHRVALSTAGTALYERCASHVHALDAAVRALPERATEPSGTLRITAPHDFGAIVLPPIVHRFCLRHPEIKFDIRLTNEAVDLVAEGFDAALRAGGQLPDSTMIARRIQGVEVRMFASPGYLARRGQPRRLGDPGHEWISFARGAGGQVTRAFEAEPRLRCDDLTLLRNLLIADAGIGPLPGFLARPALAAGELVEVLGHLELASTGAIYFVYPSSGQVPRKVSAFRDALVAGLSDRAS